jgi:N-dimethylarginine dimethylaminohydrolase
MTQADNALTHILMCAPDHFDVSYRINPWMDPASWAKDSSRYTALAREQWRGLTELLRKLGVKLELMEPVAGLPDMVFTANGGLVLDGKAIVPNFRCVERQGESAYFKAFFEALKTKGMLTDVHTLPATAVFEGAGDCLWDVTRENFWMGYGQRSGAGAAPLVASYFGKPVIALELVDPRFYHLDTCLRPLEKGHVLYFPGAFSTEARGQIAAHVGEEFRIPVDEADATVFACNCVTFGTTIVVSSVSPALRKRLESAGYTVHETPLFAFHRSGGSALCLTLRLDQRARNAQGLPRKTAA